MGKNTRAKHGKSGNQNGKGNYARIGWAITKWGDHSTPDSKLFAPQYNKATARGWQERIQATHFHDLGKALQARDALTVWCDLGWAVVPLYNRITIDM